MGLDIYATRDGQYGNITIDDLEEFGKANLTLCGGLLSSNGGGASFRGKVYSQLVERITGKSLYDEKITPHEVGTMTMMLRAARDTIALYKKDLPAELHDDLRDIEELYKFFSICSERGLGLEGEW